LFQSSFTLLIKETEIVWALQQLLNKVIVRLKLVLIDHIL